jgi:hypothetical protein
MASGNHYSRQVQQLEALLNSKLKQVCSLQLVDGPAVVLLL